MIRKTSRQVWHWTRSLDLFIPISVFLITGLLYAFIELADDVLAGKFQREKGQEDD
jgi:hypothetical protein